MLFSSPSLSLVVRPNNDVVVGFPFVVGLNVRDIVRLLVVVGRSVQEIVYLLVIGSGDVGNNDDNEVEGCVVGRDVAGEVVVSFPVIIGLSVGDIVGLLLLLLLVNGKGVAV